MPLRWMDSQFHSVYYKSIEKTNVKIIPAFVGLILRQKTD